MRYSRSHRRHHRARLLKKRLKEALRSGSENAVNYAEWLHRTPRMRVDTPCACSCHMCGNPRRKYGNSKAALTMQELRHLE